MRPCFIILDYDFPGSISARKLVIESAKLNVITAYSQQEAIDTLQRYRGVDGVVLNAQVEGRLSCRELVETLRKVRGDVPVITVSASGHDPCGGEDFHVSSYDPRQLLSVLEEVCPQSTYAIEHDEERADEIKQKKHDKK